MVWRRLSLAAGLAVALAGPALALSTLRIGMTAADIPLTDGQPDQGFEGNRFTGIPLFDSLTGWDLSSAENPPVIIPSLASEWAVDEADKTRWMFRPRRDVKLHDGADFDADAVAWNVPKILDRDAPYDDAREGGLTATPMPTLPGQDLKPLDVNVEFDVVDWNTLFTNWRRYRTDASAQGAHATNVSFAAMGPFFAMVRVSVGKMAAPASNNWGMCNDPKFDAMIADAGSTFEPAARDAALAKLHAAGVDEALFIWIGHDVAPRPMSPRVKGYVQPQRWFVDLRLPSVQ